MRNSLCTMAFLLCLAAIPAQAQDCAGPYQTVTQLAFPAERSYPVWSAQYGEKTQNERFEAGAASADGQTVLAGFRETGKSLKLILAQLDMRGRATWEKSYSFKDVKAITKMFVRKGQYVLLADQGEGVWIGFFSAKGGLVRQARVSELGSKLQGYDLIESNDGRGFILAAGSRPKSGGAASAVLFRLDEKGAITGSRSYMPGMNSSLRALAAVKGGYVAGGSLRAESGLDSAWAARFDETLALEWQRTYPQDGALVIARLAALSNGTIVAAGQAGIGIWAAGIDSGSGAPAWQRFFMADRKNGDLALRDLLTEDDGRFNLLAQVPAPDEAPDYAALLAVSPYGLLQDIETFGQMEGAEAYDVFVGARGQRGVAGLAYQTVALRDPEKPDAEPANRLDTNGWVLGAVALPTPEPRCGALPEASSP